MSRQRFFWVVGILLSFSFILLFMSCSTGGAEVISIEKIDKLEDPVTFFAGFYSPVKVDVEPKIPQYSLPLKPNAIANYNSVVNKLRLTNTAKSYLSKNGFVVIPFGQVDDIVKPYETLKDREIPIFVTCDTLLHLYHIQFGETLKEIEEKEFYPDLIKATEGMQKKSMTQYDNFGGDLKAAAKNNVAFFTIALKLLNPDAEVPGYVKKKVDQELENIKAHTGFKPSPLFTYNEDYSQYVPRGHYTRSEELKKYFKAMMWYGRMTFLLKGHKNFGTMSPPAKALISPDEAKIQTLQAMLISANVDDVKAGDRTVAEVWNRIYLVTAYYVGFSDDLSIYDYREIMRKVYGTQFDSAELLDDEKLFKLRKEFALLPSPKIYGGTGESGVAVGPGEAFTPEHLDKILDSTKGLRFMGQRFVPDSYMLSQLVSPAAGDFIGRGNPFTMIKIPNGFVRGFPRGLDVMSLLGSKRAVDILKKGGDLDYTTYGKQYKKLEKEFGEFSEKDWNKNLYWSWLYALKILVSYDYSGNYQTFMKTEAWLDKELNAALGSWSSLRHDTILYAKQSYTPEMTRESVGPMPPQPKPVVGYVEPIPEFYAHLLCMTRMTNKGLTELKVLDEKAESRLKHLENILEKLVAISTKELKNEELTESDYRFIRNFGKNLEGTVAGVESKGMKTTIIADVHTDQNTKKCLEEGTGYVDLIIAAYKLPDGRILIGAGPTLSYYEFKHPMSDRLTDEKWRKMLKTGKQPERPSWIKSFYTKE